MEGEIFIKLCCFSRYRMSVRFVVRHRGFFRSRVQFPVLRGDALFCVEVEKLAALFPAIGSLEARPRTGSVIIFHSHGFSDFNALADAIAELRQGFVSPEPSSPLVEQGKKRYHVSGLSLFFSGLYLGYLSLKRLALTVVSSSLFRLPTLVTLGLAWPVQRQAIDNLKKNGRPDMGLISTGLLYYSLFAGNVLAAYTIFWLFNLSGWLESRIQQRTRQTIREMLLAKEERVWLQRGDEAGAEIEVAASTLQPGDMVVLRQGSVVPVDGIIRRGQASVDESMLTGEAVAVAKQIGDCVLSGTVICGGEVVVEAQKTGEETRLAAIVRMVEAAENDPGNLQQFGERISQAMVPVSAGIFAVGLLLTGNLMQAMALLVIGCPCVLRLSSSVAVSSQVARASSEGILVKGGRYLELAARMDTLVIDKTGTLTVTGGETVALTVLDRRFSAEYLLRLAVSMQKIWPHPAGRSLLAMAKEEGLAPFHLTDTVFSVGAGVRALLKGEEILFGSEQFLLDAGVYFSPGKRKIIADTASGGNDRGASRLFLARRGECIALFTASQKFRGGEAEAIARLRAQGIRHLVLLSGDVAEGVQQAVNTFDFDEVLSAQSPEEKAEWIRVYRQKNPDAVIGMVGDGINDTPAFAAADVSFAIADGGSDITVEYGDVVVQYGGIAQVARLQELAVGAEHKIKTGYTAAITLNGLTFASTALGLLSPLAGALLHNGITVAVVGYTATGE